ncbi:MAG: TetR/AcrR family transcriptional regulator [Thermoplasmata archaeon]|nr:MAG: TetR/AcrR family transcriptional regulator [Thermoplasmata archaeon]
MARPKKDPEIMRGRILDVAEGLFSKRGYDETAVSDIVAEMGVAQGTFYYYFQSKDECLDALVGRILEADYRTVEGVLDRDDFSAPSKLLMVYQIRINRRVEHRVLDYLHLEQNAKLHYKIYRKRYNDFLPLYTRLVEDGVEEGVFDTDHPEATAAGIMLLNEMVEMLDRTPETFGIRPDIIGPLQQQIERLLGAEEGTLEGFAGLWEGLHEEQ